MTSVVTHTRENHWEPGLLPDRTLNRSLGGPAYKDLPDIWPAPGTQKVVSVSEDTFYLEFF